MLPLHSSVEMELNLRQALYYQEKTSHTSQAPLQLGVPR